MTAEKRPREFLGRLIVKVDVLYSRAIARCGCYERCAHRVFRVSLAVAGLLEEHPERRAEGSIGRFNSQVSEERHSRAGTVPVSYTHLTLPTKA